MEHGRRQGVSRRQFEMMEAFPTLITCLLCDRVDQSDLQQKSRKVQVGQNYIQLQATTCQSTDTSTDFKTVASTHVIS